MELISFLLTLLGLGISGVAYWKADDAKEAARKAVRHRNSDEDLQRLRSLIAVMEAAKEAVAPWVTGKTRDHRVGRNQQDDLSMLSEIIDALRTKAPLGLEDAQQKRIRKCASILDKEFKEITVPTDNEDHWKAALSEIQLMIPRLEQLERSIRDAQIFT